MGIKELGRFCGYLDLKFGFLEEWIKSGEIVELILVIVGGVVGEKRIEGRKVLVVVGMRRVFWVFFYLERDVGDGEFCFFLFDRRRICEMEL